MRTSKAGPALYEGMRIRVVRGDAIDMSKGEYENHVLFIAGKVPVGSTGTISQVNGFAFGITWDDPALAPNKLGRAYWLYIEHGLPDQYEEIKP